MLRYRCWLYDRAKWKSRLFYENKVIKVSLVCCLGQKAQNRHSDMEIRTIFVISCEKSYPVWAYGHFRDNRTQRANTYTYLHRLVAQCNIEKQTNGKRKRQSGKKYDVFACEKHVKAISWPVTRYQFIYGGPYSDFHISSLFFLAFCQKCFWYWRSVRK